MIIRISIPFPSHDDALSFFPTQMDQLSLDVLREMIGFLDAVDMTSIASVSRRFFHAVDHDAHWEREGKRMYPRTTNGCHDWRERIRERNRKDLGVIMNSTLLYHEDQERIYTGWQPLEHGSLTSVRMIIDPFGNDHVSFLTEPCLSVYMESARPDITFDFTIRLIGSATRKHRIWRSCHHFTTERKTWGVHQLISRSEMDPGFVMDGLCHLQLRAHVVRLRLRIVETSEMKRHRGRGLFHMDTMGHLREAMGGETMGSFRQKHFPIQPGLVFWICENREREGIMPIRPIKKEEEQRAMMNLLSDHINEREEIVLWADRFDPSDNLFFLKRLSPSEPSILLQGRMGIDDIAENMTHDSLLLQESTLEEVSLETLASTTKTVVVLLLSREDKEVVRRLYQDYRDRVFARLEEMLQDSLDHCHLLSMEKILIESSKIYTDWRIINRFRQFPNKTRFLQNLIKRPHIGYVCDRCGQIHFTGVRHQCRECQDYDLCEDCLSLPIMPHRYLFKYNDKNQKIMTRIHSVEHQAGHTLRAITL